MDTSNGTGKKPGTATVGPRKLNLQQPPVNQTELLHFLLERGCKIITPKPDSRESKDILAGISSPGLKVTFSILELVETKDENGKIMEPQEQEVVYAIEYHGLTHMTLRRTVVVLPMERKEVVYKHLFEKLSGATPKPK
jgi:hypothetical protein